MIGRACSCGQISFKNHKHKTTGVGDQIPEEGWHDLLLHNLKQLAIERFLGGGIERVLRGHLESIATDVVQNDENTWPKAYKFKFGKDVQVDRQTIRGHMVFTYEERRVRDLVREYNSGAANAYANADMTWNSVPELEQYIPLKKSLTCGEFHITAGWTVSARCTVSWHRPICSDVA